MGSSIKMPQIAYENPSFRKLYELIAEFDSLVNPFGNPKYVVRNPKSYLSEISVRYIQNAYKINLTLNSSSVELTYNTYFGENKWNYQFSTWSDQERKREGKVTLLNHYFDNSKDKEEPDEIIYLYHSAGGGAPQNGDIDLRISLKTGLVWKNYEGIPKKASQNQINTMIKHLKNSIRIIREELINKIVEEVINT
ncbi:MAG: hypothetical protein J6C46_08945 [Clostridia bacterium]|nr:hypothetical protein [Clostridia bacterium]